MRIGNGLIGTNIPILSPLRLPFRTRPLVKGDLTTKRAKASRGKVSQNVHQVRAKEMHVMSVPAVAKLGEATCTPRKRPDGLPVAFGGATKLLGARPPKL